jgi:hypothetical protein
MAWRFFAVVSLYVVDMIAYYTITLFEYLSLYIKTDNIHLIMVTYRVAIFLLKYYLLKRSKDDGRWPVGAKTCSGYVIGIKYNTFKKYQLRLTEA